MIAIVIVVRGLRLKHAVDFAGRSFRIRREIHPLSLRTFGANSEFRISVFGPKFELRSRNFELQIHMYTCVYTYVYMCVCVYIYIHIYTYTHILSCVNKYVNIYIYIYVHVYIYIYICQIVMFVLLPVHCLA